MEITIWGTRGSIPVVSADVLRYGGNTACVEVRTQAGDCIILDAGTGIRELGKSMVSQGPDAEQAQCTICLTHGHADHCQGLPFFAPLYAAGWQVQVLAADTISPGGVEETLDRLFDGWSFPLRRSGMHAKVTTQTFVTGASFCVGSATITTCATNHPGGCTAYRITADGWSFVYVGDHEQDPDAAFPEHSELGRFLVGAEAILVDGQYTQAEYRQHINWGHSAREVWPPLAAAAGVKHVVLTHFNHNASDVMLDLVDHRLQSEFSDLPVQLHLACEGMIIRRNGIVTSDVREQLQAGQAAHCQLCEFSREMGRYADTGMILDGILSEARRIGHADAGTIYLIDEGRLTFAHTQNDTLFPGSAANRHVYLNATLPITTASIVGYVVCTGQVLNVPDVYHLDPDEPYRFNDAFDKATGYRTGSILSVPLVGHNSEILGVIQLLNSTEDGKVVPFSAGIRQLVERLSLLGANAIERGLMAKELILRMIQTSALRDPRETASHVTRVGAMSAEIYHRWAERHHVTMDKLRIIKDQIRLASMLHDVGKVGIPDAVLKKPARLDSDERYIMEQHCILGARLFMTSNSDLDRMAHDIILHHHQKWDGTGYTGDPAGPFLAGEVIPLGARITAVADVFDALMSRRCYKDAWSIDEALAVLHKDAGTHFDPEIVECFVDIVEVIKAIRLRFPDVEE